VVVVGLVVGLSYVEAGVAGVVGASNDVAAAAAAAVVDKFGMYVVLLGLVVGIGRDAVGVAGQEIGAADSSFDLNLPGWHDLLPYFDNFHFVLARMLELGHCCQLDTYERSFQESSVSVCGSCSSVDGPAVTETMQWTVVASDMDL